MVAETWTEGGAEPGERRRRLVVVVDDSPEDVDVVSRLLRRSPDVDYELRRAEYGRDLFTLLDEERPDCVLLDYHLPDCTGVQVLERMGEVYGAPPVPVVMLTGSRVLVDTAVAAMHRGAMDYLAKDNITAQLLFRAIGNAIARFTDAQLLEAQRQELERRNQALDAAADRTARLLALATALAAASTPHDVARAALGELSSALSACGGLVLELAESGDALEVVDAAGLPPEFVRRWRRIPLAAELPGTQVLHDGEPVWIPDRARGTARFPNLAGQGTLSADGTSIEAWALLPLATGARATGVLVIAWPRPHEFPSAERAFLLTASRSVGQALERARLFQTAERARREAEAARAEAEDANALKSKFLATMSHELRTPLNAIAGYVDLLELGVRGSLTEPQLLDLARVRRAQQHLLSLINEVLDFARIESGRLEFHLRPVALGEELATVHALIAPQAQARALDLLVDVPADAPRAQADADRVRQILINLLSNAVKFTPAGGTVQVRVRRDGRRALVQVEDTGIGIAPGQLVRIFEPFVQVDGTLTRTREGTGLGLAISRELARGMGGDLTVESEAGRGSIFTLRLPAA